MTSYTSTHAASGSSTDICQHVCLATVLVKQLVKPVSFAAMQAGRPKQTVTPGLCVAAAMSAQALPDSDEQVFSRDCAMYSTMYGIVTGIETSVEAAAGGQCNRLRRPESQQ